MLCIKSMALLLLLLSFFASPAIADDPVYNLCQINSAENFNSNSTYSSNLNLLLSTLSSNASAKGFASSTIGRNPDTVYGFAFCRGDSDFATCSSCISTAISNIKKLCPNSKVGATWYDYCQLFYSNQDVIHEPDLNSSYQYTLKNPNNVSSNEALRFEILIIALMEKVSDLAVSNPSRFFATGEAPLTSTEIIYGHVQCSLDLSADECRSCLQVLVNLIKVDDQKLCEGRRAMGLWCSMRYEFYKFYNSKSTVQLSYDQLSSPPPSSSSLSSPSPTYLPPVLSRGGIVLGQKKL